MAQVQFATKLNIDTWNRLEAACKKRDLVKSQVTEKAINLYLDMIEKDEENQLMLFGDQEQEINEKTPAEIELENIKKQQDEKRERDRLRKKAQREAKKSTQNL